MGSYQEPPKTPPHPTYPLTPPPTGGSVKRVRFTGPRLEQPTHSNGLPQLLTHLQEIATSEVNGSSTNTPQLYTDSTTKITPPTSPAPSSDTIHSKHTPSAPLAITTDTPPFRFMDLPPSIRTRIYTHLVTIPSLISVRQNHTPFHREKHAYLYTAPRALLPGIAYAPTQQHVNGPKSRFSTHSTANAAILRASTQVHAEAKQIMYGANSFEIPRPSPEMTPPPDFSIRLFPRGYQGLVSRLVVRIRSFCNLGWLLAEGCGELRRYYRGLETLTLILELDEESKSLAKAWARGKGEKWSVYVRRLHGMIAKEINAHWEGKKTVRVPAWVRLRVMFSGEAYDARAAVEGGAEVGRDGAAGLAQHEELRRAFVEAWGLFGKKEEGKVAVGGQ